MTSECQIWDDGTYCAEGEENIKHTNKSCYCAMISQLNKISGECNGRFNLFLPSPSPPDGQRIKEKKLIYN